MMTVRDIEEQVEIQAVYKIVGYDDKKDKRVDLTYRKDARDREIEYMYVVDGVLYFEVELDTSDRNKCAY